MPVAVVWTWLQKGSVEAWARTWKAEIVQWCSDKAEPSGIEGRPGLLRALSALGPESRVLCVAQPAVLHDAWWARTIVERLAVYAGGSVSYAAFEVASDSCRHELDEALAMHERMLRQLQVMRASDVRMPRDAVWGRVPWGYRLAPDGMSLERNEAELAVVSVIRHMRSRGLKLREIKDELEALGVVSRTGRPLGITRIL